MNKRDFMKILASAGVAIPVAAVTANQSASSSVVDTDPTERILKTGIIRAGYIVYAPFVIKDVATGKLSGFGYDFAQKLASNMGLKIEWVEEVFFGNAFEGLNTGRYDVVIANLWPNATRARVGDFLDPLYYSGLCVYARPGDHRFDNLNAINDPAVKISTIDGEIAEMVAAMRFPRAKLFSMPQSTEYSQLLWNVVYGKADVAFAEASFGNQFLKENPGVLINVTAQQPMQVYPNAFSIKRGYGELKDFFNTAIGELHNSGFVDDLLNTYEKIPGDYYRVDRPYRMAGIL